MKLFFLLISIQASTGCFPNNENEVSQAHFTKVCDWEYENPTECEELNGKHIKLAGTVYLPEEKNVARLFPLGTNVPAHDDDELWDELPDDGPDDIILWIDDDTNDSSKTNFTKFHQKSVIVKGLVNTECVKAQRELSEKTDEENKSRNSEDEMTISWLTGFCHYYSEYITDVKISEIKK